MGKVNIDTIEVIIMVIVGIIIGIIIGMVFLIIIIDNGKLQRLTHQCEVLSKNYNCIEYSSRYINDSKCECVGDNKEIIIFNNTYGD